MVNKFVPIAIVVIAYYAYTVVELMQLRRPVALHHNKDCTRIESDIPSEDIVLWKSRIIGATGDGIPMYYKHLAGQSARPGALITVDPHTRQVSKIETSGFPSHFKLNGHGLTVVGDTLYVLSHSYDKGGEVVFLFDLSIKDSKVHASFKDSYSFGDVHGNYNGIAVFNESHFYVTQWIPFPDQVEGRDNSVLATVRRMGISTYYRSNPVRLCNVEKDKTVTCVDKASGFIPNGILYHQKQLYFADSIERTVSVFNVKENLDLVLVQRVPISHTLDNLCAVGDKVYVTGINKLVDYVLFGESVKAGGKLHLVPGGFSRIEQANGKWKAEEVIMQDLISLPSSVAILDDIVTFTSIVDAAFVFCPLPK